MGLIDRIKAKMEIRRLEQRYTRREKRSTFISGAQYVDGEYVYKQSTGGSSTSSSSVESSSNTHCAPANAHGNNATATSSYTPAIGTGSANMSYTPAIGTGSAHISYVPAIGHGSANNSYMPANGTPFAANGTASTTKNKRMSKLFA